MIKIFKTTKKYLVSMLTLVLILSPVLYATPVKAENAGILTAQEIMRDMGTGFNIGNSLDSYGRGGGSDIYAWEQAWNNPVVTQELISTIHRKGFNTVRIPVTWYEHILNRSDYSIDENWLGRVKAVVDYAIDEDMYVIINVHHEQWLNRSDFAIAYESISPELKAVWRQIANYFEDYDQHLIFEGMNEPRICKGQESEWTTDDPAVFEVINRLNADFVETVRSVDSPYQYTRLLMIPGYAASADKSIYEKVIIPGGNDKNGDGYDDYVAISIHAYKPFDFALGSGDHSVFSDSYDCELKKILYDIWFTFVSKGVPVVIGEYSASNYGYDNARVEWAKAYMTYAKELGIPCVLWDNNKDRNYDDPSESHGYIDRNNNEWRTSGGKVVDQIIETYNDESIVWGSGILPAKNHNGLLEDNQLRVEFDSDSAFITKSGMPSDFTSDKEIAITFKSNIPVIELMDSSWGGYMQVEPDDYSRVGDNYVAYFPIASIISAWNDTNPGKTLWNMKVSGYISNGCSSYLLNRSNEQQPEGDTAKIEFATVVDNGTIGINFYMTLTDAVNQVIINGPAGEKAVTKSQLSVASDGLYIAPYGIAAKDMDKTITVKAVDENGDIVALSNELAVDGIFNSTFNSIIDIAIEDNTKPNLSNYCKKLKIYGEYASAYFNSTVATSLLDSLNAADLSDYDSVISGTLPDGIEYIGSSLILRDAISVRHYFKGDLSEKVILADKQQIKPIGVGDVYYIELPGIRMSELGHMISTQINGWSISYCPYSYCYKALESDNLQLVNLIKALRAVAVSQY